MLCDAVPIDVPSFGQSRAEALASALELQRIGDGANHWIAHVLGVHNDGRHLWAQIAPRADGTQSIVLRVSMAATPRHALATLATLSRESLGSVNIVPVMCTV
jgi:hypothetical protein